MMIKSHAIALALIGTVIFSTAANAETDFVLSIPDGKEVTLKCQFSTALESKLEVKQFPYECLHGPQIWEWSNKDAQRWNAPNPLTVKTTGSVTSTFKIRAYYTINAKDVGWHKATGKLLADEAERKVYEFQFGKPNESETKNNSVTLTINIVHAKSGTAERSDGN